MAKPFLSVVIPAYNEAKRLPLTLIDVDRHLSEQNFSYEIIVALSPSTDDTASVLARFTHLIKKMKVVALTEDKGKGFALKEGIRNAKGVWCVGMDADNAVAIVEFIKMVPYLKEGSDPEKNTGRYEVLIGSRRAKGAYLNPAPPLGSWILSSIGAFLSRIFILHSIRDAFAGFFCISKEAADIAVEKSLLQSRAAEVELLQILKKQGYEIKEIPVFYSHDHHSTLTLAARLSLCLDILRIWWRSLRGAYNK